MEQKMEVAQGFYTGQTRGGRTCLDLTNQHPTCPQAPCQLPPHPMHLMHPFHPGIPLETPRAWALMAVAFFVAWFESNNSASCTVTVDVTVPAQAES